MGGFFGLGNTPNFSGYIGLALGTWGGDAGLYCAVAPVGLAFGTNPSFYLDDFYGYFPKWFGIPVLIANAGTTAGTNSVTAPSTAGMALGQFLMGADFPKGTIITGIGINSITVNNNAMDTNPNASFNVFETPPVPISIIQSYINLANANLRQAQWLEMWAQGMAWFTAHYLTLYAKSDAAEFTSLLQSAIHSETPAGAIPGTVYTLSAAPPSGVLQGLFVNGAFQRPSIDYTVSGSTITLNASTGAGDTIQATWPVQTTVMTMGQPSTAQLAAQGLINGVMSSKSVGDVSASFQVLNEQEGFGAFRLTTYGALLIDAAKVIGSGPVLFV